MTSPDSPEVRGSILRLFEAAREAPGSPYEPERFLAHLTAVPAASGRGVADTFAGRRRLVRLLDAIQLELGICFTTEEWERGFGLGEAVEVVEAKRRAPAQQRRLAEKRIRQARATLAGEPVRFGLLGAGLLALPAAFGGAVVRVVVALLWLAMMAAIVAVNVRQVRYARRLAARIAGEAHGGSEEAEDTR